MVYRTMIFMKGRAMSEITSHFHSRHHVTSIEHGLRMMREGWIVGFEVGVYRLNEKTNEDVWCPGLRVVKNTKTIAICDLAIMNKHGNVGELMQLPMTDKNTCIQIENAKQAIKLGIHDYMQGNQITFKSF